MGALPEAYTHIHTHNTLLTITIEVGLAVLKSSLYVYGPIVGETIIVWTEPGLCRHQ